MKSFFAPRIATSALVALLLLAGTALIPPAPAAASPMLYTYTGLDWTNSFGSGYVPSPAGSNLTIQFTYDGPLPGTYSDLTLTTNFTMTSGGITLNSWEHQSGNLSIMIAAIGGSLPTRWYFNINDVGGGTGYAMNAGYPEAFDSATTDLYYYATNNQTFQSSSITSFQGTWTAVAVPLPPSVLLLGSGLLGLAGWRRFRKS